MLNEAEACRLVNEASIIKRELEQSERKVEDLWRSVENEEQDSEAKVHRQIEVKLANLRESRKLVK